MTVLYVSSAIYGFRNVSRCREVTGLDPVSPPRRQRMNRAEEKAEEEAAQERARERRESAAAQAAGQAAAAASHQSPKPAPRGEARPLR